MALSNLTGWNEKSATSACGASDKPEEKPAAFGSACGADDAACGSACGASDK